MKWYSLLLWCCIITFPLQLFSQDVTLYQQFNGRFDYLAIGNTMNLVENGLFAPCKINTSSSADLNLTTSQNIEAAYLYWAGSDNGDFEISLNGIEINAERTFSDAIDGNRSFFAAFADVTEIIQDQGNTTYTVSDLDLSSVISSYCPSGTNFAGWAMTIIYQDDNLPLNQLNVYDGLQSVPDVLNITLDNLNVLDTNGAKIGFIAWEGDSSLAVNEQLTINGNVIGNAPLNPVNNAFNGTNSFTGQNNLYNMDIDVYNIQNNINIGDTTATISLTSGQDFVMINNIITVLNSQLPDATVVIDATTNNCGENTVSLDYTVFNLNATEVLPANTPISFYVENMLIAQSATTDIILIGESESGSINLLIPDNFPTNLDIDVVVDDDGTGLGLVTEINEMNNFDTIEIELLVLPEIQTLDDDLQCDIGFDRAEFNLETLVTDQISVNLNDVTFYESLEDLQTFSNTILNTQTFENTVNPQTIYVRVESNPCYFTYQLELNVENCPPTVPQGFSPNLDSKNDWFNIQGLYDIFEEHQLLIFNRYGVLIFEGDNSKPWLGKTNRGLNHRGELVPVGTYFYILKLNDQNFSNIQGWVYVNY
ncbi:gliding motility-associated C-terminal domain-containing protein [Ichthyenterobacterium sp. W332]|uniref:Gliding motility-associated C-terminal domain-containing protein n=1 Tax=Microcosmobacter mediterraneus TaxID=3075607 RepID=A0ABU2YH96_9FLAO|nr:gliding motility-associated C-terminal domain-containing protein [Ichthyenterobacterium sp. W332]MDT0557069.1 gliding motility-associated C-terminal domain-containing protein [Ichthyenterobacterium sp. W332]